MYRRHTRPAASRWERHVSVPSGRGDPVTRHTVLGGQGSPHAVASPFHHPDRRSRHRGGAVAAGRVGGRLPGEVRWRSGEPAVHVGRHGAGPGGRARRDGVPRGHHYRRTAHRGPRSVHRQDGLGDAERARHGQPDRRPGTAGRRLLPGHLDPQHHPRLEPRQPVRVAHPRRLERRPGGDRGTGEPQAVQLRLPHLRLRARPGLRLRVHGQGQQQPGLLPGRDAAGGRRRRVARARDPARGRGEGCPARAVRAQARPHLHGRHQQRRLPGALAAGEPARSSTTAGWTGRARC